MAKHTDKSRTVAAKHETQARKQARADKSRQASAAGRYVKAVAR